MDSLKEKTARALSWSFLESAGLQGLRFIIGIVLARLLFPEQFGLIGMLTIFINVAQSLLESGFGSALVQKLEVQHTDACSIFYFNLVIGIVVAGLLCIVAPWIAAFYNQPVLTSLTRALSSIIVINSFGLIQQTLLIKEINFKTQMKVSLLAGLLSGMIGVVMAIKGFGVWSIVGQQISGSVFQTVLLWCLNSWRPSLIFSFKALRDMFGFGSRMLFSSLLSQIFDNIYLLVIGKLFTAADLGFFTRAKSLQEPPVQALSGMVGRVTFPVFSSIQDDPVRLKRGLRKALTILVLVNFPMMIGLAAIAPPLVIVLLTEKWAKCIPYVQLLCFSGLLYPLHVINLNLLQSLGRSDIFLKLEIIKKFLVIINIITTWRWGLSAMICGIVAASVISYYLNSYYTGRFIGYPIQEQLQDLFPYLIMAALMGIAVYVLGMLSFPNPWSLLSVQIVSGIGVYVGLCRLFRLATFMEIWQDTWNTRHFLKAAQPIE